MLSAEQNELITRTGPNTPMGTYFRRFWVPVLLSSKLPKPDCPPVRVTIMSEELVAFRATSGQIGLVDADCAHRCAPLFYGRNEQNGLRCIYHGWKYDVDGNCVDMPNEPASSSFKERVKLKAYPTQDAGGLVWAYMGPQDRMPEMPLLDFISVPASHRYVDAYLVDANYLQATEGDHDSSHVSFLHSTLNDSVDDPSPHAAASKFNDLHVRGKLPTLFVLETPYGFLTAARRDAGPEHFYWRITPWLTPFYSVIANEPGAPIGVNVRVPANDETSWNFRLTYAPHRPLNQAELDAYRHGGYRYPHTDEPDGYIPSANKGNDYLIDRYVQRYENYSGIRSFLDQDKAVTEGHPILDRTREHLSSADAGLIRLRRCLIKAAQALEMGTEPDQAQDGSLYRIRSAAVVLPRSVSFEEGAAPYMSCQAWERQAIESQASDFQA